MSINTSTTKMMPKWMPTFPIQFVNILPHDAKEEKEFATLWNTFENAMFRARAEDVDLDDDEGGPPQVAMDEDFFLPAVVEEVENVQYINEVTKRARSPLAPATTSTTTTTTRDETAELDRTLVASTSAVPYGNDKMTNMSPPKRKSRRVVATANQFDTIPTLNASDVPRFEIANLESEIQILEGTTTTGPSIVVKKSPRKRPQDRIHRPIPPPPPLLPSRETSPSPAAPFKLATDDSKKKGKVKAKPRLSLEAAVDEVNKISTHDKLVKKFPTISSYIDYLESHEVARPREGRKPLEGCRIAFVNTNSRSRSSKKTNRNAFDLALRQPMARAFKEGATLVKPEDFVPSPLDTPWNNADEAQKLAEEKGWTTHVIPLILMGNPIVTFEKVLTALGESGIELNQLGPVVRVVRQEWMDRSIKNDLPLLYWERFDAGDTRPVAWGDTRSLSRMRHVNKAIDKPQIRAVEDDKVLERSDEIMDDVEDENGGSNRTFDEVYSGGGSRIDRSISPLNETDFPPGEIQPGYDFTRQRLVTPSTVGAATFENQAGDVSIGTSDPIIVDTSFRGLEPPPPPSPPKARQRGSRR